MRRAMAEAEVGDDAYGEDPTVNELERVFAERVGKEAALFVPSGTMGNQIALRVLAARLFNAEVAMGVPASQLAAPGTTVMCCLSKGLCAPVGSLLAGPAAAIADARRERAVLGGQMRQAGVLAAAGRVALMTMVERLADDHRRARRLA